MFSTAGIDDAGRKGMREAPLVPSLEGRGSPPWQPDNKSGMEEGVLPPMLMMLTSVLHSKRKKCI